MMQAPIYKGNFCWTTQQKKKKLRELAKEAEEMPPLTNFFMVSYTFAQVHDFLTHCTERTKTATISFT